MGFSFILYSADEETFMHLSTGLEWATSAFHVEAKASLKAITWLKDNILSSVVIATLVQHVGQAMLTYQTANFLIPKNFCHKIDAHLNRFWWGEDPKSKKRKLHLLAIENIFDEWIRYWLQLNPYNDVSNRIGTYPMIACMCCSRPVET